MLDFICNVPGASASTVAWHAAVQLGLTAVVLVAGAGFLAAAVVAFRRSGQPGSASLSPVDGPARHGGDRTLRLP